MINKKPRSLLATNIVKLRDAKKWSQADLAHRVGVHLNTIKTIETDKSEGTFETRMAIAGALEVEMADLYRDTASLHHSHPSDEDLVVLGGAFALSSEGRRALALYILTRDEIYYRRAAAIPDALPLARVLKKSLLSS